MDALRLVDYQSPLLIDNCEQELSQYYDCESCSSYVPPNSPCSNYERDNIYPSQVFNSISMEHAQMECHQYFCHLICSYCDNGIKWCKKMYCELYTKIRRLSYNGYSKM